MTDADRERLAQIRRDMTLERRYPDGQILHGYQATGVSDALWLLNLAERLAAERDRLRAAIGPFAALWESALCRARGEPCHGHLYLWGQDTHLRLSHCQAAHAALAPPA